MYIEKVVEIENALQTFQLKLDNHIKYYDIFSLTVPFFAFFCILKMKWLLSLIHPLLVFPIQENCIFECKYTQYMFYLQLTIELNMYCIYI